MSFDGGVFFCHVCVSHTPPVTFSCSRNHNLFDRQFVTREHIESWRLELGTRRRPWPWSLVDFGKYRMWMLVSEEVNLDESRHLYARVHSRAQREQPARTYVAALFTSRHSQHSRGHDAFDCGFRMPFWTITAFYFHLLSSYSFRFSKQARPRTWSRLRAFLVAQRQTAGIENFRVVFGND